MKSRGATAKRRTGWGQDTSVRGLHSAFPLCRQCFHISEHLRHGGSQIKMFMEPNPSWLLGFNFLVFSQLFLLHPKLEIGFITLLLKAQGKVIDVFGFQLKSYNFRCHFQFSNK